MKVADKSTENMEKFKHVATNVTNQNHIHVRIKSTLNLKNAGYHLVQTLMLAILKKKN